MSQIDISIVCCDSSPERFTQIVTKTVDLDDIEKRVVETVEQNLEAGVTRGLHNAAHHDVHGPVTYFQEIHEGGFFVTVGPPDDLKETFFGPGQWVAFTDDQGPGHGSRVGPDGVRRTLRVLKGLLS